MLDQPDRIQTRSGSSTAVRAPGIGPLFKSLNPATAYLQFWNQSAFKASGEIAQSWLHFLGNRWAIDLAFPLQIAQCKTADDLCVAYSEFWQQAARDYSVEFNDIASTAWATVRGTPNVASEPCCSNGCKSSGNKRSCS
jgi:hypothetical protein